ncbi:hypothetical protein RN001_005766 [Aquatica leii]|uniref:DNA-directed DNA polymerase n=1 Tax=Aquatica leii TaxID=1421715 RepID=A0AAN7PCA3_9COLE|nr:hypothetical protein RN001_005766 [Aquatica leii]
MKLPFVVYADFEAILKPIVENVEANINTDNNSSYTVRCYEHEPYSFAYYIKCSYDDSLSKLETFRGKDAAKVIMNRLENDIIGIYKNYLSNKKVMIPLTDSEQLSHINADYCHICEKVCVMEEKVYDHDHLTGLYRGPAHSVCNINYKIPRFVPIFFHNLSNYDSHMFVKDIVLKKEEIDVIAQNKEKYISFSKKVHVDDVTNCNGKKQKLFIKLRFVDSFRFMASSLEKLGSYLQDNQCIETRKYFSEDSKFDLVRQKGVFPYSYVDAFEKLDVTKLPDSKDFYDTLNDEHVSEENYARAKLAWNIFNCETIGDYSDVYVVSDVLMLADIFENFRTICLQYYKLDPCHYFTAPGFGWDALLRMTGVKLDLLTDIDMLHFFKKVCVAV